MKANPETMTKDEKLQFVADHLSKHCQEIAAILILTSKDESHLLDGIKIANEIIRTLACEGFVKCQKEKEKQ